MQEVLLSSAQSEKHEEPTTKRSKLNAANDEDDDNDDDFSSSSDRDDNNNNNDEDSEISKNVTTKKTQQSTQQLENSNNSNNINKSKNSVVISTNNSRSGDNHFLNVKGDKKKKKKKKTTNNNKNGKNNENTTTTTNNNSSSNNTEDAMEMDKKDEEGKSSVAADDDKRKNSKVKKESNNNHTKDHDVDDNDSDQEDGEVSDGEEKKKKLPQQDKSKSSNKSSSNGEAADTEKEQKEDDAAATTNGAIRRGSSADSGSVSSKPDKDKSKEKKKSKKGDGSTTDKNTPAAAASSAPPPPVMKGTLSYDLDQKRHLIRGMWNYEHSNVFPPQRFELLRNLTPEEDPKVLPKDGEFHGSFSLAYFHTTSKGKQKERSKVIPESGVQIKFTPENSTSNNNIKNSDNGGSENNNSNGKVSYKVDGKGTNQFGIFHINGTATPNDAEGDPTLNIVLRKRYEPAPTPGGDGGGASASSATAGDATAVAAKSKSGESSGKAAKLAASGAASGASGEAEQDTGPLPPPSKSFPSGVVCLRGKLYKEESADLGLADIVHRINGMWSSGLDVILADPQNVRGLCNRFEYEHKSSVPSNAFPVSGRYSGWFDLSQDDGTRTRINERDVTLKFKKNNAGYHNVEGKGSNVFGKYSITGTLTMDNVITIFRHFQPRKFKRQTPAAAAAAAPAELAAATVTAAPGAVVILAPGAVVPPAATATVAQRRPSVAGAAEPQLKLDDVKLPTEAEAAKPVEPVLPPANTTYSAVSRGILRLNDDGSHSCNGKWAVTREHFTNGQTSNFVFRLEAHHAQDAAASMKNGKTGSAATPRQFPLDSAMYKGSFQLKKQGSRYQTIVDNQVVMKFCTNTQGSYNVYGRGVNAIGIFNLIGTMVMAGKTGGQVELYRMYPPELLHAAAGGPTPAGGKTLAAMTATTVSSPTVAAAAAAGGLVAPLSIAVPPAGPAGVKSATNTPVAPLSSSVPPMPAPSSLQRRESTRLVKLPSKLEDDDPNAQLTRVMQKCSQILRLIREKDVELGAFFSEPVDPVALGIPTYHQVIKEPMDLRTVNRRMEAGNIETPEEFSRLVRLVFENAMTFNVDPAHSVHQAARSLLVLFNQKFRDVERMLPNIRRAQGDDDDKSKKKGGKDDKKRKRGSDEPKSLKRIRLDEAQAMAEANANAVAAIVAAAPAVGSAPVSRAEFNLLLSLLQQLQKQIVETHTAVAELSPGDETDEPETITKTADTVKSTTTKTTTAKTVTPAPAAAAPAAASSSAAPAPASERKKAVKRKSMSDSAPEEPAPVIDDSKPLTLEEQELLTETINDLPPEHLGGVIQIIREAAPVGADEDEIDLEIDQLDTKTQRKLLRHVTKFVKKPKTKPKKKPKTTPTITKKAEKEQPPPKKAAASAKAAPKPKPAAESFFAFGAKADSDSDSDDDDSNKKAAPMSAPIPHRPKPNPPGGKGFQMASKEFKLGGLGNDLDGNDDDDDDDDEDIDAGGLAANWSIAKPVSQSADADEDDDDAWVASREHAAAEKAREEERKAREEKLKAEAEVAKAERIKAMAAKGEELKAKRLEEEERQARLKEKQEKEAEEARKKAREEARAQVQSVEQTVDLDAQRDIMKQYEQSFLDKDYGSASPSSDFGF